MIFCTYWFLLAIVIFLPLYWLIKKPQLRLFLLLVFSAIFHTHFAGPAGVIPIVVLALITYLIGLACHALKANRLAGWLCISGMVIVAAALIFYKYSFFILNDVMALVNKPLADYFASQVQAGMPAAPPLAISFFAFEFIHYLFEVRRGSPPIKAPHEFAIFAIFFPSLVAGPIKRYQDFIPSLKLGLAQTSSIPIAQGLLRLSLGFFKKLVIADNLNQYILAKQPFFDVMDVPERWLFLMALTFRIYYDFCGYTDIALGLAMTMGIKLPQNFRAPYKASNIRDFWQRWHMSLSFWIRDYIYIPLGGSKHGALRRVINGLVAFALCGLWHGASYNYLLWGLYHGSALAINNYYRQLVWLKPLAGFFDRYPRASQAATFLFVASGWLLFFYPAARAWQMWLLLFGIKGVAGD